MLFQQFSSAPWPTLIATYTFLARQQLGFEKSETFNYPKEWYTTSERKKNIEVVDMASDRIWGGLPFITPSRTAMKYLYHTKVMSEDEVPVGAHYRAREDMMNNVRNHFF